MLDKPIKILKLELASEETNKRVILVSNKLIPVILFFYFKRKAIEELKQDNYVDNLMEKSTSAESELWVEKFKPRDFFELLSEDVNKSLKNL